MTDGLRVQVLGPVVIAVGDEELTVRRPLERGLLVRLALARGVGVPDERLAADLWDAEDDDSRTARLRVVVSRLRRTLGAAAGAVVRAGDGYRLTADVTDLRAAAAAADRVHAALRAGDHDAARSAAAEALGIWRGPALADLRTLPFGRSEGDRLDAWRLELAVQRLTAELALGAGADVVAELTELAAGNPLHEPLRGMLAVALYRAGRQADALAEIAGLRRALADELGVDPTADTADLEVRLLRQDPGLQPTVPSPSRTAPATTDIRPALADGLVGRRAELVTLATCLDDALVGRPGVVLVEGGPGTGRTRLLEALGGLAEQHGAVVCRGRSTAAGGAPAFWPWRQALRQWARGVPSETAALVTAGPGAPIGRIVPELAPPGGTSAASGPVDPDDRFGLFEHVVAFLDDAAAAGPGLVLLLDDLHLADLASLLLLAHVAGSASGSRLLVAASLRPGELGDDRAEARAGLVREPATTRVELGGLSAEAVTELLGLVLDRPADPGTAAEVARRTGGNPLFVTEIGRAMAAGAAGVPTVVRDAVRGQLDALAPRSRRVLSAAAVLASVVDTDVVAAAVDEPLAEVFDELDAAARAGFLLATDRPDRFRFAHEIVRESVLLDVGSGDRSRMHLRAAELLESTGAGEARIAHHRLEALPLGDRERAVGAVTSAADLAVRQFAFEDAVALYERGLAAGSALDLGVRADLLLRVARARFLGNDVSGAIAAGEQAAALAEHRGDIPLLARAATALPDVGDPLWHTSVRRWCRTALAALPPGDGPLRAQLTAQLAAASLWDDDGVGDPLVSGSAAALEMAERVGDTTATFTALRARQLARSDPDGTDERLGLGTRMLGLAHAAGDPAELWGRLWRFDAFVQLGRIDEADEELTLLEPVVDRMRQPLPRWHLIRSRAALLAGRGRFPEAREAADEAVRAAERGRHRSGEYPAHFLRLSVSLLTGDPIDERVFDVERYQPPPRILSMAAAEWHATHGDRAEAERIHSRLPRPGTVELLPFMPLPFHAIGGSLAALLGDDEAAGYAYDRLLPHADRHIVVGAGVSATGGSVQLVLGTIAAALGHTDAAVDHLRAAVVANDSSGLVPYATLARARLAEQLRTRSGPGDDSEADAAGAEAGATAARLGMPLR